MQARANDARATKSYQWSGNDIPKGYWNVIRELRMRIVEELNLNSEIEFDENMELNSMHVLITGRIAYVISLILFLF